VVNSKSVVGSGEWPWLVLSQKNGRVTISNAAFKAAAVAKA